VSSGRDNFVFENVRILCSRSTDRSFYGTWNISRVSHDFYARIFVQILGSLKLLQK